MKKVIIVLFLLSIATIALLKGSSWYLTQQFVDKQIVQAKAFAQISYKKIETSLSGSAIVSDVQVFIPAINDTIRIKSIQFTAPDLLSFLMLDSKLKQKELPESLTLLITDAVVSIKGPIMTMMDNSDTDPTPIEAFSTLACGDVRRIDSKALSKMGYDNISSTIFLGYRFHPLDKRLSYNIDTTIDGISNIRLSGELSGIKNLISLSDNDYKPGKTVLEIEDDTYIERKNNFCARQENTTVAEYLNEHFRLVQEYLPLYGITVESGLLNAYRELLKSSATITFEANLGQLSGTTEELKTFEPNDIIQFIRLKLFVNNKRIHDLSIKIDKDRLIETAIDDDKVSVEIPETIKKKQIIVKKYRPVSTAQLRQYNGYRVKIKTSNGKNYKGTLNADNAKFFEVNTRLKSGNIGYQVPVNSIKTAEVFY